MKTTIAAVALALVVGAGPALAAAPIEGTWQTETGEHVAFSACGASYCLKLLTGPKKGTMLSRDLKPSGENAYSGSLFNPRDERTYAGSATLVGAKTLKLQGCALKIFCKTQTWSRVK